MVANNNKYPASTHCLKPNTRIPCLEPSLCFNNRPFRHHHISRLFLNTNEGKGTIYLQNPHRAADLWQVCEAGKHWLPLPESGGAGRGRSGLWPQHTSAAPGTPLGDWTRRSYLENHQEAASVCCQSRKSVTLSGRCSDLETERNVE